MNTASHNHDIEGDAALDRAIRAAAAQPIADDVKQRVLDAGARLAERPPRRESGGADAAAPSAAPRGRRVPGIARRFGVRAPLAAAVVLAVAACVAIFGVVVWAPTGLAFAEVSDRLATIEAVHLVIRDTSPGQVELWYRRGTGFRLESALGVELDDGTHFWDYSAAKKVVVKSASRLREGGYASVEELGSAMGFSIADAPETLARLAEADQTLDGQRCLAYAWTEKNELSLKESEGLPDELRSDRRIVFLLDGMKRIRRCEFQRGLAGKWTTYRSVEASYPAAESIPADRFEPRFGEGVRIVEAAGGVEKIGDVAVDSQVARIVKGIARRQSSYYGLKFKLRVSNEVKRGPKSLPGGEGFGLTDGMLQARDEFAMLAPSVAEGRPWRFWQREVKDGNRWRLTDFLAFDGTNTNRLTATHNNPQGRFRGSIVPFEDTLSPYRQFNVFDRVLTLRLNGTDDAAVFESGVEGWNLDRFRVIGKKATPLGEVLVLKGSVSAEFGVEFTAEVTGAPHFHIVRWLARIPKEENRLAAGYEIEQLGTFDGVSYPAKGRFRQVGGGYSNDVTYTFEVMSVERLPDDARSHWMPAWPPSTLVVDQAKDTTFQTPAEGEQR